MSNRHPFCMFRQFLMASSVTEMGGEYHCITWLTLFPAVLYNPKDELVAGGSKEDCLVDDGFQLVNKSVCPQVVSSKNCNGRC